MKQIFTLIAAPALFASALLSAAPAIAEPAAAAVSIVNTGDLDLTSPVGRDRLEQRLVTAAHAVCDTASAVDLKAVNGERECRAQVLAAARARASAIIAENRGSPLVVAVRN
jgi:UrcA family protein